MSTQNPTLNTALCNFYAGHHSRMKETQRYNFFVQFFALCIWNIDKSGPKFSGLCHVPEIEQYVQNAGKYIKFSEVVLRMSLVQNLQVFCVTKPNAINASAYFLLFTLEGY